MSRARRWSRWLAVCAVLLAMGSATSLHADGSRSRSRSSSGFGDDDSPNGCGECRGRVTRLTLKYLGVEEVDLVVEQRNDAIIFDRAVAPGEEFILLGTDRGSFGSEIKLIVNDELNATIHTSCSQSIGVGLVFGEFEIVSGESREGGRLCDSDDVPPPADACGDCRDGVSKLTLVYNGSEAATVRVEQRNGDVVFDNVVEAGGEFDFMATDDGEFGRSIEIFVNDAAHVEVHTSCSRPIGPGLVVGDFVVVAGTSHEGGELCPLPECSSLDGTNSRSCWRNRGNKELELLITGSANTPFDPPVVCGMIVETPNALRWILYGGGHSSRPCNKFKRAALTTILNIRRSILIGDGMLGEDGADCFGVRSFRLVLRCGEIFIPDESTEDPDDAIVVTEETPVKDLVALGSVLCELADCPDSNSAACGRTIKELAEILHHVNDSNTREGECGICRGDHEPPQISCPSETLTFECQGPEGAAIDYRVEATDNCDPNPHILCFPPPGTVIPMGAPRSVHCWAKDLRGNMRDCTFDVRVVDTTSPDIVCPDSPITVDCIPGAEDGAIVDFPPPHASDLCDQSVDIICDPSSGSFFPFGSTTVSCTAVDDSGNIATCEFVINVVEQTPPELTCPGDIRVECNSHSGTVVNYPPPMLSALCAPPPDPVCDPLPGSTFQLGTTTVHCQTTDDDGGLVECEFNVTVEDTQAPSIVCPQDISIECLGPTGSPVTFEVPASDICDSDVDVVCNPASGSTFSIGQTVVACVATDDSGNQSRCEFTVLVVDTTAPDITCPQGPILASCNLTKPIGGGAVVNYPAPVVADRCDESPTVVCVPASGSVFPLGPSVVTCTATDADGNRSECSFDVEVVDETPPELVCVEDMFVECTSEAGANVEYSLPVMSNECNGVPALVCVPASGSLFPIGSTVVTCTATDQNGNIAECGFTISVDDSTPPQLSCPADITVECATPMGTMVDFTAPAVDTCDPNPVVVCNPASGNFFPPGLTIVECVATDAAGNESRCEFNISVVDTTPPVLTCPESMEDIECESPNGTPVTFQASAIDLCDPNVSVTCNPESGSTFRHGRTVVVCTAVDDSGNTSQCEFTIRVIDTTAPDIECITEGIRNECDSFLGASIQYPLPVVSDVCDPEPLTDCDPPIGTILPIGVHTIVCQATDASGNSASCSFELEVVDTAPPDLMCVEEVVRECTGPEGAIVEYPSPAVSDTCDPAPSLICLPASGSVFSIGDTTVTCTAEDQDGNMVMCEFVVTVRDTTPPLIQCPGDIAAMCSSPKGTPIAFGVSAVDLCDSNPIVECNPPSGTRFPIGDTVVTCTAVDSASNDSQCSFTITIIDDVPPEIVCVPSFQVECIENNGAIVEYPAPSAFDDCDAEVDVVCEPVSGTFLELGAHVISCTATDDAGNEASCEFTVTVVDTTAPELVCPANVKIQCEGPDGTTVEYPVPVANDACDGQPPVVCTPESGSVFALGNTEIVCRSVDSSGNATECSFFVQVVDVLDPDITCPELIEVDCDGPDGTIVKFVVTAVDECDGPVEVNCDPPSGSLFPIGQTAVTCDATDASGNKTLCAFEVRVIDRTPPVITCPVDLFLECTTAGQPASRPAGWPEDNERGALQCTTVVEYDLPSATDECSSAESPIFIDCQPPPGTRFELGVHTFRCRARDFSGNESECTFTVEIVQGPLAFIRGDANGDPDIDIADAIRMLRWLFQGGSPPECEDSSDANDDGDLDIADSTYLLSYLFSGTQPPPHPYLPLCGLDLTADKLADCDDVPLCR